MSEIELIVACKKNEMWARKILYERYAPTMLSVCTRYCGDKETAKDILQEGFFKIFTKISEFREDGSFEGWIRKIFVTTALENLRKNRFVPLETEHKNTVENDDLSVFDKLSADDLHKIISELPDGFRMVFNLYAVEGYSHKEIGEMLGIKEVTSRSQYQRAREMLKKWLMVND
ncbi:MAG: sigma-70 family RNA polymerase sigma factor [Prevotellaceae bacterium]|nr:sigma-70 family RNA polymerase sigma factor [Prevotellaceae bacterium]